MSRRRVFLIGAAMAIVAGALVAVTPVGGSIRAPLPDMPRFAGSHAPTPPSVINFQGVLTNPTTGNLVADGNYSIAFRVFDVASGGTSLWTETQGSVAVSGGRFSVLLGSVTPFPGALFAGTPRYLEVQVGADPPLTPRQQWSAVPYAFHATTADSADTAESAGALSRLGFSATTVDSVGNVGQHTSVAIGTDGLPLISYQDLTNHALKAVHCGNTACSSGNAISTVATANTGGDVFYTSIAVGSDELPVISYYDSGTADLRVAHCGNAACSAGNTQTTVDSAGSVGFYTSITIGADGLPVISYNDGTNGDLKVAKCGNAACSAGNTLTTVGSAGFVGEYTSITIGADGLPVISYNDATNGNLKVAKCGNAACSAGNSLTTVGSGGFYTSITIGADGLPVISYEDFSSFSLTVAKCGNAACSAGNILTTIFLGAHTSITIGADGLPVISSWDGSLKVAKCGNAACSVGNTPTTVDSTGNAGEYPSITIGADGLPVISYYDDTNSDLKVAHCSNRYCTPYHRPR